ncbi:MAG: hypothetical protein ACM3SU_17875, partial [Acidobacteriota bacterium]
GKTTALVSTLAVLHAMGVAAGATSAGRDGEDFDALTGEPKPRFRLWPGQLVASAESTLSCATFPFALLARLPHPTRFGPVVVARVEAPGELEVMGPSTAAQTAQAAAALEAQGARIVLLDGAFGRRAFASARVADGIVLAVGMSAGSSLESVLDRARFAVGLIGLAPPPAGRTRRAFDGALTDELLHERPPEPGQALVARDFASIFLSSEEMRRLGNRDVVVGVEHPARLLAVTANPSAPGRPPLPAAKFFDALALAFPEISLFDVQANLRRDVPSR